MSEPQRGERDEPDVDLRVLCTSVIRGYVALATRPVDEAGLTLPQWGVLERCARGQANTITELTEIVPVDQASLSRAADKLVRLGLLKRQRQSRDRRVVRLVATPKGQALVRHLSPEIAAVYAILLEGIQEDEFQVFTRVARKIAANARGRPVEERRKVTTVLRHSRARPDQELGPTVTAKALVSYPRLRRLKPIVRPA
ncbi:MAG: MarR family transcriptional regulator [Chloroflexota bacterium]|nr:MarR family transcriptional regulator [Chloroflexota bacterium]MDE2918384.1 MarR family transcriptional regulator [Chloroflexota bacterium]